VLSVSAVEEALKARVVPDHPARPTLCTSGPEIPASTDSTSTMFDDFSLTKKFSTPPRGLITPTFVQH